jgi:hypothetical protein
MRKLFFLLLFISINSYPYDFEVNEFYYNIVDGEMWDVDYPCVEITYDNTLDGRARREKNASVKSLIIPDTVRYDGIIYRVIGIGMSAFLQCPALSSLTLPEGLIYIDDNALAGRKPLSLLTIPNTVTTIGDCVFWECNLKEMVIPESVTYIGAELFHSCHALESVTLPSGITRIPHDMFCDCQSLRQVNIPEGVNRIENYAFGCCPMLTSIHLPSSLKYIESHAFFICMRLTDVNFPSGLKEIGSYAFYWTPTTKKFKSPTDMSVINEWSFCRAGLESVIITPNIQKICRSAFEYNEGLQTVQIEGCTIEIEEGAFAGCRNIKDFYCLTDVMPATDSLAFAQYEYPPMTVEGSAFGISRGNLVGKTYAIEQATLHVHKSLLNRFKNTYPWSEFKSIVAIEDETAIGPIAVDDESSSTRRVYDLVGRLRRAAQPGLNVIVGSDGRSRKVMVK